MITININKAKTIAHDMRRASRETEFAPHDAVIAKQIPGAATQEAEVTRQAIRDKYAAIQVQIDAAVTPEQLKAALPKDPS